MPGYRIGRINDDIKQELSAMLPTLKDPRVRGIISITRVDTTADLRYCKVYISALDRENLDQVIKGLKSAAGYLRRELGSALQLRYTPELQWELDDSITYGAKMLKLINSLDKGSDDEE
jgi:ribosome-binding factor A